jgi:hypothetical protein
VPSLNEGDVIWNGAVAAIPLVETAPHRTQAENTRRPICRDAGMRSSRMVFEAAHSSAADLELPIKN